MSDCAFSLGLRLSCACVRSMRMVSPGGPGLVGDPCLGSIVRGQGFLDAGDAFVAGDVRRWRFPTADRGVDDWAGRRPPRGHSGRYAPTDVSESLIAAAGR